MNSLNNYYSPRTQHQRYNEFTGQVEHTRVLSEIKAKHPRPSKQWLFSKKGQTNPKQTNRKEGLEWNY